LNVFSDPSGISAVGRHFIGGVLAHLPALVALTCGSVNSYRRLMPSMWAGAYACYGFDNREAAVRICSPLGAAGSVNLELKPCDNTANPYLALGAFIYAGLDGVRNELDPGEPLSADPASLGDAERARLAVTRLPESLGRALGELEADPVLMTALGPLRSSAYLAVKRSEVAHFAAHDTAYECYHHAAKF
jgi:glutamine synthetase